MSLRSCPSHTHHHGPIKASYVVGSVRVDLKEVSAFTCLRVCSVNILEVHMHRVALNEGETRDQSSSRGSRECSLRLTPMRIIFLHTHTSDTPSLIPTLVLLEIAKITGITVFTALIYYRLKPLNNSACTHRRAHTQPWAPVCGLSGAADGWLIDWGGPLMISVANDLLNNSLGLCWGADGRPNTYTDILAGTLVHTHAFIWTLICIYSNIYTHTSFLHTQKVSSHSVSPSLSPLLFTLGVLHVTTALIPWYHDAELYYQNKSLQTLVSQILDYQYPPLSVLSRLQFLCTTLDLLSVCLYFKHTSWAPLDL